MGKPHKHAELIKAWANGAEIQFKLSSGDWADVPCHPAFYADHEYRIKPERVYPESSLTIDEICEFVQKNNGDMKLLADFIVARHCQDQEAQK